LQLKNIFADNLQTILMPNIKPNELNSNISVDCVVFGFDLSFNELKVLLIERKAPEDFVGNFPLFALPGDLIKNDENLDEAATRVLKELTNLDNVYLKQFKAYGNPDRVSNTKDSDWLRNFRSDPEARVVTIAYFSLVEFNKFHPKAAHFAKNVVWMPISEIPELAFDHNEILEGALKSLQEKARYYPVGIDLLPEKFTLSQFQKLYEVISNQNLDKRNFRRKILKMNFLVPINEKQSNVSHKPANLFVFNKEINVESAIY